MRWPVFSLAELVDAKPGFACGQDVADGVFQFRMNNITTAGTVDLSKRRLVPHSSRKLHEFLLRPGDVLFNATNSPELVGKSAFFAGLDEPATFSNHFLRLRTSGSVDGRYLARWLTWQQQRQTFSGLCRRWVNQASVSREALLNLAIPLPPLPEQRRIADILDQADALRAKRRSVIAGLDSLTQSIFVDLFKDKNSHSWKPTPLPECYWFQEGPGVRNWQFTNNGVKLLNVGNIEKNGTLNLAKTNKYIAEEEAYGKYNHFLVDPGDLVIASSGISFDRDGLLRTRGAFVSQQNLPLCMNTSTIRFKAIEGVSDLRFLWVWLGSTEFRSQITRRVTGSAQQNFGPSHLKYLTVTLPPLPIQEDFAARVEVVDSLRSIQQIHQDELDSIFASLQHHAFLGEL